MEWQPIDNPPKENGYYQILTGGKAKGRDGVEREFPYNAYFSDWSWSMGAKADSVLQEKP